MHLDLASLADLGISGLGLAAGPAALGDTERGPFRLEVYAPGIVRLTIGDATLPDYALLAAPEDPPPVDAV